MSSVPRPYKYFDVLMAGFVTSLLVTGTVASKLFAPIVGLIFNGGARSHPDQLHIGGHPHRSLWICPHPKGHLDRILRCGLHVAGVLGRRTGPARPDLAAPGGIRFHPRSGSPDCSRQPDSVLSRRIHKLLCAGQNENLHQRKILVDANHRFDAGCSGCRHRGFCRRGFLRHPRLSR